MQLIVVSDRVDPSNRLVGLGTWKPYKVSPKDLRLSPRQDFVKSSVWSVWCLLTENG